MYKWAVFRAKVVRLRYKDNSFTKISKIFFHCSFIYPENEGKFDLSLIFSIFQDKILLL